MIKIKLGNKARDVNLVLPSGKEILLQWRLEAPSLDICLPYVTSVTNMKKEMPGKSHKADQIVIDVNPEDLKEK